MDLFNTKALAATNARIAGLEQEILHLKSDRDSLAHNIREMDTLIFTMSQCSNWNQMQPYYQALQGRMEARRQRESDRIQSIIFDELNATPRPPMRGMKNL